MMCPVDRSELAYIGLGANVGATHHALRRAIAALQALPGASLAGVSRLYRTRPVGPVAQADFLNAAVGLRVPAGGDPGPAAMALLMALKDIERALGRQERERWGPREIDLDLLLFGRHRLHLERDTAARSEDPAKGDAQWLEVPHPQAAVRAFVLAPLADLAPDLTPPAWGMSVARALQRALAREGRTTIQVVAAWDPGSASWQGLLEGADRRPGGARPNEISGGSGGAP